MTRGGRIAVALVVVAAVVLEVVVSWVYRNDTDTIFANAALVIYALIAIGAVVIVDRIVRVRRGQANPLFSRFVGRSIALIVAVAVVLEVVPGIDGFSVGVFAVMAVLLVLLGDLLVGQTRRLVRRVRRSRATAA